MGRERVRFEQIRDHDERARSVHDAGWPNACVIAIEAENLRLVHGNPMIDQIAETRADPTRQANEMGEIRVRLPSTKRREPARIREVVKRDDRGDAARAAGGGDGAIVGESRIVVVALLGLEPAPLDGEAIGIEP